MVASRRRAAWRSSASMFQSPSLRGSGRFHTPIIMPDGKVFVFQSPSLRGSGRFAPTSPRSSARFRFQSPSLRGSGRFMDINPQSPDQPVFQSPSLRGSGRFLTTRLVTRFKRSWFQSPSLRGSGRFALLSLGSPGLHQDVSIPFIAGQWSLPAVWRAQREAEARFNPLHCGAVVASRGAIGREG